MEEIQPRRTTGGITDIKNVPQSPNTGIMPNPVYNPLEEDFTHNFEGKPYTIPAGEIIQLPEVIAYHLATHLAELIVSKGWIEKLNRDAVNVPENMKYAFLNKAVPRKEIQDVMEALVSGNKDVFHSLELSTPPPPPVVKPPVQVPPEEPEKPDVPKSVQPEVPDYDTMSWQDLRKAAKEKGIFDKTMKKQEVISALKVIL